MNLGFLLREDLLLCSSYLPLGVPNWVVICLHQVFFWRRCRGERRFLQEESRTHNHLLCNLFCFILFLLASFYQKHKKISSYIELVIMSSLVAVTMSPEEMIFTSNKRVRRVSKKLGLEFMLAMEKLNQE
jgi:hypothetical protein